MNTKRIEAVNNVVKELLEEFSRDLSVYFTEKSTFSSKECLKILDKVLTEYSSYLDGMD